jgi:phosphohistidine phosphatase
MKKLILVRHAKSSWNHNVIDHERPLNERGLNDIPLVSKAFDNLGFKVDLVLSSDAYRAKKTSEIFTSNLSLDSLEVVYKYELYDFSGELLIKVIKSCFASVNCLMVFGHNHAITDFVNQYGDKPIDNVPTCGVVVINFETSDWNSLKKGTTAVTIFPKDLK